jgi:hypothetical protein
MDSLRHHHPIASSRFFFGRGICWNCRIRWGILSLLLVLAFSTLSATESPYTAWEKSLTPPSGSPFHALAPFRATYRFGWEGIPAGGASVEVSNGSSPRSLKIRAEGGPNSVIRKLWNYHARYLGEAEANGQVPSWFRMDEEVGKGDLISEAAFTEGVAVSCHRFVWEEKPWKVTRLPGVRDLFAAMLYVRSLPLHDGDRLLLTIFPDQNPYLVDLQVEGREVLRIGERNIPAIRFRVGIRTVVTTGPEIGRLAPHKKFRSGRVWMTDDARRLPLRAEVDVFIGSVFAELAKVTPAL